MTHDNRTLAFVARILMALIFVVAGLRKLLAFGATAGYFAKLGLPMPEVLVVLTIALELIGSAALIAGWHVRVVAAAMALFTIAAAAVGHQFWAVADPAAFSAQLNHFLKNVAMVGGFLLLIQTAQPPARQPPV
jgi:putative oxidoreductase